MIVTINVTHVKRTRNIQRLAGMHGCDDSVWLAILSLPVITLYGYGRTEADARADVINHARIWQAHTQAIVDALDRI